ncbi:hypothetical protein L1987_27321 [Smallanthus sonchifolius]|uniref:Uncharacterized protein n=1 Tax=Smallanthus sonchifolius TaxID=185202 RepID=A0ACB9IB30_9ASTR|nr:hypothetical protein L1987_27321 [Smallanthus sonchifolius]
MDDKFDALKKYHNSQVAVPSNQTFPANYETNLVISATDSRPNEETLVAGGCSTNHFRSARNKKEGEIDMDAFIDHDIVLGLASGEEGLNFLEKEITTAYRSKALEVHPDKRPEDPNAVNEFQRLQTSYEILKNEQSRKAFDANLMIRIHQQRHSDLEENMNPSDPEETKCWRMMFDLEERNIMKMMDDLEERNRIRRMSV